MYFRERYSIMTLTEFFNKKYRERKDKDNMYGVGMSDTEFRQFIIDYLLPDGWCVTDPIGQSQINALNILERDQFLVISFAAMHDD